MQYAMDKNILAKLPRPGLCVSNLRVYAIKPVYVCMHSCSGSKCAHGQQSMHMLCPSIGLRTPILDEIGECSPPLEFHACV